MTRPVVLTLIPTTVQTEHRNPSPDEYENVVRRTLSAESVEPWDQRHTSDGKEEKASAGEQAIAMRNDKGSSDEDELEDGDLPSLNTSRNAKGNVGGRIVNGQRTTTRPLSPPSQAGLTIPIENKQFWGQLDDDLEEREATRFSPEVPLDESPIPRGRIGASRRHTEEYWEEDSRGTSRGLSAESYEHEPNFCAQALDAIGDICGVPILEAPAEQAKVKSAENPERIHRKTVEDEPRARPTNPAGAGTGEDQIHEYTAIEVEFVEPKSAQSASERKKAYLTAISKKAKEDFDSKKDSSEPQQESSYARPDLDSPASFDVYNNFNASDKRKFLKLINCGLSPSAAADQVSKERTNDDRLKIEKMASRVSKLAFWKKGQSLKPEASNGGKIQILVPEEPMPPSQTSIEEIVPKETLRIIKSETVTLEEVEPPASESAVFIAAKGPKLPNDKLLKDNSIHDTTHPESDSSEGEPPGHFAKSGINYYDAIRKDQSEDEVSIDEYPVVSTNGVLARSSRTGSRRATYLMSRGFAMLEEKRARNVPGTDSSVPPLPPLTPSRADGAMDVEFTAAGNVAVMGAKEEKLEEHSRVGPEKRYETEQPTQRSTVKSLSSTDTNIGNSSNNNENANSLVHIEKTLLRPVPKEEFVSPVLSAAAVAVAREKVNLPEGKVTEIMKHNEDQLEEEVVRPSISGNVEKKRSSNSGKVNMDSLEVDMHTYFNSTAEYSVTGESGTQDNMSIHTAGTGLTTVSNYTQSSRVRRPGAARGRLAQAKQVNATSSKKGWHESIRAAAASTNRVWHPAHGWIDFKDLESVNLAEKSNEKLHVNLDRSLKPRGRIEEMNSPAGSTSEEAVNVAFPPDWEQERMRMLISHVERDPAISVSNNQESVLSASSSKHRGWVESMRAASAAITEDSWDPNTGWKNAGQSLTREDTESLNMKSGSFEPQQQLQPERDPREGKIAVSSSGDNIQEDDESYLLNRSDSFPLLKMDGNPPPANPISSVTNVVKEKVGEEEFDLFHHQESNVGRRRQDGLGSSPPSSPGRSSGPVDVDEVDVTDDSEDELSNNEQESSSFLDSAGPVSASSGIDRTKKVPKLLRSKRDTSPHRDRKASTFAITPAMTAEVPLDFVPVTPDDQDHDAGKAALSPAAIEETPFTNGETTTQDRENEHSGSDVSLVKERLQHWEHRSGRGSPEAVEVTPEWKRFLGKKVLAESVAAAKQDVAAAKQDVSLRKAEEPKGRKSVREQELFSVSLSPRKEATATYKEDDDTLFEFSGKGSQRTLQTDAAASALDVSDLSPIEAKGESSDQENSEAYGPAPSDRRSFFQRMTECAAPVMASSAMQCAGPVNLLSAKHSKEGDAIPMAHLAFLRSNANAAGSNPGPGNYLPTTLCGRAGASQEDGSAVESYHANDGDRAAKELGNTVPESTSGSAERSRSRSRGSEVRATARSVVSDDGFGAKTAYLEALAMKAAVAKPDRRSDSRRRSSGSSVVSSSSQHSEKWKSFLERKKTGGTTPPKSRPGSSVEGGTTPPKARPASSLDVDVSTAAEKYAAEKAEEMMSMMASRSRSAPRRTSSRDRRLNSMTNRTTAAKSNRGVSVERDRSHKKTDSGSRAAEDLAAARVEAMMAALSSSRLEDEGEI